MSTRRVWPAGIVTRVNPTSFFAGRSTGDPMNRPYTCTTSSPSRVPVLATSTLTVTVSGSAIAWRDTARFENANVV